MWQISLALLRDMEEMKIVPSAVTMSFGHGHGACRLLHGCGTSLVELLPFSETSTWGLEPDPPMQEGNYRSRGRRP